MNYRIYSCAVILAAAVTVHGDGLRKQNIAPDAKWLIHIDCDKLRQTEIGTYLIKKWVEPKVAEAAGEHQAGVSNILQRISSLTAYGTDFATGRDSSGVLLINSDADTQKALEGLLVAQILADTNGPVKKLPNDTHALYSIANQILVSPQKGGSIVISKSETQIELAQQRLAGKAPTATAPPFSQFPAVPNGFFFLGVAEGLTLPTPIPAQAKILQMADGGRVVLGERKEGVFVDIALRGKTAEVASQIKQVIEGMVALVTLGQPNNADLVNLAKSTHVSATNELIAISVECPASTIIAKLNDEMKPKPKPEKAPRQKARVRAKPKKDVTVEKAPAQPEAENETEPK